jgi:hypothetical protein
VTAVELLSPSDEETYEAAVRACPGGLVYYSLAYRDFLRSILVNARDTYLIAREGDRVVGLLPSFLVDHPTEGRLLNALPFYGSHGMPLTVPGPANAGDVVASLLGAFHDMARAEGVRASTVVGNPTVTEDIEPMRYGVTHVDHRIGQMTDISNIVRDDAEEGLFDLFHQKTRNAVRKGLKGEFSFRQSTDQADMQWLQKTHAANMAAIGGAAKPLPVFAAIQACFAAGEGYTIHLAELDGRIAGGVLVLFYNGTAEYFTPAIADEYRERQVLSAVVFEAMKDAVSRGCRNWNWGGTWPTQEGVYRFKSRWGAADKPYRYFTSVFDAELTATSPKRLAEAFPYFYAFPFSASTAKPQCA